MTGVFSVKVGTTHDHQKPNTPQSNQSTRDQHISSKCIAADPTGIAVARVLWPQVSGKKLLS
jgi:hypothetical protein